MQTPTDTTLVTIEIPSGLYARLKQLAEIQQTDIVEIIENGLSSAQTAPTEVTHERVEEVSRVTQTAPTEVTHERVEEILLAAGLIRPTPLGFTTEPPLSEEERDEIAIRVGSTGRPLSEIIIEERGGR